MGEAVRVAIIGDYNPKASHHVMSNESLKHAASTLQVEVDVVWIPTDEISTDPSDQLIDFDAIWCSSGSPYKSASGAISAIQYAREQNRPFFATWGGFQHALLEYARNVLGMSDAEHEEDSPGAEKPIISKMYCSLSGLTQKVAIFENTNAYEAYHAKSAEEQFLCNYGVNPKYQDQIIRQPVIVSGVGPDGEIRIIEIPDHRFYVATLFVPQMLSKEGAPHPLILNYMSAAKEFRLS